MIQISKAQAVGVVLVLLSLVLLQVKLPAIPWGPWPLTPAKVDRVTFVYEKDDHAIPSGVQVGLSTLNQRGILATIFEQDTVDGSGETPEQYKVALKAAKDAGLPSAVAQAGAKVTKVAKNPTLDTHVLELAP